ARRQLAICQPGRPEVEARFGYPQTCAADGMRSAPLRADRPVEEGEIRAGASLPVGVEEMVGGCVVLVDGLLDQAQAERVRVEALVGGRIGGDGRQVVNAVQVHGNLLFSCTNMWRSAVALQHPTIGGGVRSLRTVARHL